MFNRDRSTGKPTTRADTPGPGGKRGMFSVIGPDVTISGTVTATADLHIDGRIEGDVTCGALVQGAGSHIIGTVAAQSARLGGQIEGNVTVRQLSVERAARIRGDVEYETIAIENGASIDGRLRHASAAAPSAATEEPIRLISAVEASGAAA